jgi:hypothetical protein
MDRVLPSAGTGGIRLNRATSTPARSIERESVQEGMESLVLMNEGCSHEPHLWPEQLPAIANGPAPPLPTAVHRTGRHDSSNAHRPAHQCHHAWRGLGLTFSASVDFLHAQCSVRL